MKITPICAGQVYCVDLAKNKFQVHVFSPTGERLQQHTLSRVRFQAYFSDPRKVGLDALVVMEACGSSHYWAHWLQHRGYAVKLVPPQFVAKRRHGNKTDGNDCDGIYAVHGDSRVRPVPVKSLEQQDLCAQHRLRELLVKQRTQFINQARGLLAERGCVAARGEAGFRGLLERVACRSDDQITASFAEMMALIAEQLQVIDAQIAVLDTRFEIVLATSPIAQRLDGIFGVGPVTATAFAGEFGNHVERFADARQFAANLGITPSEHSSGERRRLGPVSKRGNSYLRALLVQCAQAVVTSSTRRSDALCVFAHRLLEQHKHRNRVIVAVANRLARIIYAVIKHERDYQPRWRTQTA